MKIQRTQEPSGKTKLHIEVPYADLKSYLEKAAKRISERIEIPGFRKGQVPFSVLKTKYSEGAILEEAASDIVMHSFAEACQKEQLETVGKPEIQVLKSAPQNPFVFTAIVAILPCITIPDFAMISVKKETPHVTDEDVEKTFHELRRMRAKEKLVKREARLGDKVVIDFTIRRGGVPIEGGTATKMPLVLGDKRFIPGFEEQAMGMTTGQEKTFDLTFPKDYHEKSLAGAITSVELKVHDVYELLLPELNEEFAKSLGKYQTLEDVRNAIRKNLEREQGQKFQDRADVVMCEQLMEKTTYGTLPEELFSAETERMLEELRHRVEQSGGKFTDYLLHLKKTEEELKKELRPEAEKRVKIGLALREIVKRENIEVSEEEITAEQKALETVYANQPQIRNQVRTPQYRTYLKDRLTHRKVFELLRSKTVQ